MTNQTFMGSAKWPLIIMLAVGSYNVGTFLQKEKDTRKYNSAVSELKTELERSAPHRIIVKDLNGDGVNDLVARSFNNNYIFLGNSNGSYTSFKDYKLNQESDEQIRKTRLQESFSNIEKSALDFTNPEVPSK